MKRNLVFVILLLNSVILHGRGLELSEEANVIRQITMCIYDDFLSANKELPTTFDNIPTLREWVDRDKSLVSFVNRLAIVPNSRTIRPIQGVSNKFANYRLFAISRNNSFDKVLSSEGADKESGGRHSILIKEGDMRVMWIPESQAQLILNQIKGFDPAAQPLAFVDRSQPANKTQEAEPTPPPVRPEHTSPNKFPTLPKMAKAEEPFPWWFAACAFLSLLIVAAIGYRLFCSRKTGI